ncbi:MAG: hypothetical protein AAF149_16140 [Bacteroidota bacterium]
MPANKKYLLETKRARISKIIAAIVGGLVATHAVLMLVALLGWQDFVVLTIWFVWPSLWVFFICVVYWVKKPVKVWGLLGTIILVCSVAIYLLKAGG